MPKDGARGLWTYWDKNGRKIEEGYFSVNGVAKGNWSFWDKKAESDWERKLNMKYLLTKMQLKI